MRYFLDFGSHLFEGLREFVEKLNLNKDDTVYSYEPNIKTYELSRQDNKIIEGFENQFKSFKHYNLAVMDYSGKIIFNAHNGAWSNNTKTEYLHGYYGGSNCLNFDLIYDPLSNAHFDIRREECECIDIEEIISSIVLNDPSAEIIIKCDIEGSEFVVLPKLLKSKYIHHVKSIYIEWHERFWHDREDYQEKINQKTSIIEGFKSLKIPDYIHY